MKKIGLIILQVFLSASIFAQNYDVKKLKVVSTIWGETYLFHPSITRADKSVEWEKQLVEFLPKIKYPMTEEVFIEIINTDLLSALNDPFTLLQSEKTKHISSSLKATNSFDYLRIKENQFADISNIHSFDSLITDKTSQKPLVIDLRIDNKLDLDLHTNTMLDYFAAMLIKTEIPSSMQASREHYGWDENNDWWLYEQRWKVATIDKQQMSNGKLLPLASYAQELQQYLPDIDFSSISPIERPIYFITNNSILSYYYSLLMALKNNRPNTFFLNENSGTIYSANQNMLQYSFDYAEFILNTAFYINNGLPEIDFDLNSKELNPSMIESFVNSKHQNETKTNHFSFEISPKIYTSPNKNLSVEEKILGIVKIWTTVKYFYAYPSRFTADWNNSLEKYLDLAQNTSSDKDYFTLVQEMMSALNDSHSTTFHPSIVDFSNLFVAPVKFEWIEDKVIVTALDTTIHADIKVGDEILSIDDVPIPNILENEQKKISASNRQSLIATVINPGYFVGAQESPMKLALKRGSKTKNVDLSRTTYFFQFLGFGDNRASSEVLPNNIGYLNLAFLTNTQELELELQKMQNTNGLIIDLRNSYPTADYGRFLSMLCTTSVTGRISEVPIITANSRGKTQSETLKSNINPDRSFTYSKKIVVLIDKSMISRPEDIAINLKAFTNVKFVGEQTQGTDGEMTKILLPGGGETSFTGENIKFGDGSNFQGIGILPDIEVKRTTKGAIENRDEILEKAIEIIIKN